MVIYRTSAERGVASERDDKRPGHRNKKSITINQIDMGFNECKMFAEIDDPEDIYSDDETVRSWYEREYQD